MEVFTVQTNVLLLLLFFPSLHFKVPKVLFRRSVDYLGTVESPVNFFTNQDLRINCSLSFAKVAQTCFNISNDLFLLHNFSSFFPH